MQEINWKNFAAKFNGKEQSSFENLCYLLFCEEYNRNLGIFRYKNQAGIETVPIQHNGKTIGFQAKYFENSISDNKKKIKDAIEKAKNQNPNLNKIIFYINKEFSKESIKGEKAPKYQIELEQYARDRKIEIEWRCKSFFESPFVCKNNSAIAKYFFSFDKSIIDFIENLNEHTQSIINPIDSHILFQDKEIKIDRTNIFQDLKTKMSENPVVILSGDTGVGKTAIVKDYFEIMNGKTPFYIFKALEFNVININDIFSKYGPYTLRDFINEHQYNKDKIIVIDSAEKLADIEQKDVLNEFLSKLIKADWNVIFTTRYSYIEALESILAGICRIPFRTIIVNKIDDLDTIARVNNFTLPQNNKLLELLATPFYLNEYLRIYNSLDKTINYNDFKKALWNNQILKIDYQNNNAHKKREECFLKIAFSRAEQRNFAVNANECDGETLQALSLAGIIKYDSAFGGYFITHDIYEEWALDIIVERAFQRTKEHRAFLQDIGTSFPIRRALRRWLSDKLQDHSDEVKRLIERIINDKELASYWQDEVYISILQSEYVEEFFDSFHDKLLENNASLLMRLVFILRIACKEIDEELYSLLGIKKSEQDLLTITFIKPKGHGWNSIINFIYDHKEKIDFSNANIIIPLLDDWNNKNKTGETTKKASLIALFYYNHYDQVAKNGRYQYSSRDHEKEKLIIVILKGASEIAYELKIIFDEVISKNSNKYNDKYHDIVSMILESSVNAVEVVKVLPQNIIQLADMFWHKPPKITYDYDIDINSHFGITNKYEFEYFPSSALQTPIFILLKVATVDTINFILSFTNRAVEYYRKSEFSNEVSIIKVVFDDKQINEQYISDRLWNTYRGTHVSTDLLQSIHMALEKWLLIYAKEANKEDIEKLCFYLLKETRSASITAIITSVCLAYPSKLFNIASILFKTKEFFLFDTDRMIRDQGAKGIYSIGYGLRYESDIYQDERILTCDEPHRKLSLENLAFKYQLEQFEGDSPDEVKHRQKVIWEILDLYYKNIPNQSVETNEDKTWRLFLARMDARKMTPKLEKSNGDTLIAFYPKIDSDLKEYSENSTSTALAAIKHTSIKLWASYRFEMNPDYLQYKNFEENPELVITETREILLSLEKGEDPFPGFNRSIPAYTCSVLIRDFIDQLSVEDKEFCKNIIIKYSVIPFMSSEYYYQIDDGTEPSITTLPLLTRLFPQDSDEIKQLLVISLLNPWENITKFAVKGIRKWLWEFNHDDVNSIFLWYLFMKPKFNEFIGNVKRNGNINDIKETSPLALFIDKYDDEFENTTLNNITLNDLGDLSNLELSTMEIAFELIPPNAEQADFISFLDIFLPIFAKELTDNRSKTDYRIKSRFMEAFAYFVLNSSKEKINIYLQPFIENFDDLENMARLLQEFILIENKLKHYEEFWIVWDAFYDCVLNTCKSQTSNFYLSSLIHNYLLAWPYWEKDIREWHSLKGKNKVFYKRISEDIGHHPSVLDSIAKILNEIGSNFDDDGIVWISNMLQNNSQYKSIELETNTISYLEMLMKRYTYINRQRIKSSKILKDRIIIILDFLFNRGSTIGYLLREDIL